jgi:hypothetical protein
LHSHLLNVLCRPILLQSLELLLFYTSHTDHNVQYSYILLQVLELLLFYASHTDHNVVTASLEALHQLLKHAPRSLVNVLITRSGVGRMNIQEKFEPTQRAESKSQLVAIITVIIEALPFVSVANEKRPHLRFWFRFLCHQECLDRGQSSPERPPKLFCCQLRASITPTYQPS